jgi:putative peptidoglycan lipid II flippase
MPTDTRQSEATSRSGVSSSAFKVMAGGILSVLAGFINQIVITSLFGTGLEMDAFFTALAVPIYLQAVLVSGLSFVFIPAFVREESTGNPTDAWALVGTFVFLTGGILICIALAGAFFADDIIQLIAPGLSADKAILAVDMLTIMIFTVPLIGLGSLTQGIQNARNRFFWPSVATAANSLISIAALLVLYPLLNGLALAWAYLIAIAVQASITVTPVLRHGWTRLLPLSDARVREMAWLITPFLLFGLLTRYVPIVERYFASDLSDGEISYLGYALKISSILVSLLGGGITTAVFPAMARAYNQEGTNALAEWTTYGIRVSIALSLPALAIASAVATPLVAVIFERGAFDHISTQHVSYILPYFILSDVVFFMLGNIIVRSLYVIKKTYIVQSTSALSAFLYIPLAALLVEPLGYVGLAIARPLYSSIGILVFGILLIYYLPVAQGGKLLANIGHYLGVFLATFLSTWLVSTLIASLPVLVHLLIAGSVGSLLYMVLLFLVDKEIAMAILDIAGRKVGGKLLKQLPVAYYASILNNIKKLTKKEKSHINTE